MTGMFAEPVTDKVARNYYDVIRNPMDMATMGSKAARYHKFLFQTCFSSSGHSCYYCAEVCTSPSRL